MSKKNRKRNRKKKALLNGDKNYPSKCPDCGNKTILRVSQRTRQKFVGCLGFPGCNWSWNLGNVVNPIPKYIPKIILKEEIGKMEEYYIDLQKSCDIGDEEAREKMDKLENEFWKMYI